MHSQRQYPRRRTSGDLAMTVSCRDCLHFRFHFSGGLAISPPRTGSIASTMKISLVIIGMACHLVIAVHANAVTPVMCAQQADFPGVGDGILAVRQYRTAPRDLRIQSMNFVWHTASCSAGNGWNPRMCLVHGRIGPNSRRDCVCDRVAAIHQRHYTAAAHHIACKCRLWRWNRGVPHQTAASYA